MFNRKSIYALNKKDPDAIVYMDANEVIVRLTREDFASEEEFLKWKALSDEDYHASEKEAHVYANHTLALDELSEEVASIPAVDVCMEQAHDRAEAIHRSVRKVTQIRKHLTDTQFRRVWIDHFFFASVILGFLVILGKQLFSGLVGSSGNRRVAFASLSDFDIEVGYWQFV